MENEQSKRSTPSAISFAEQQREYGYNSLREQVKKPETTILFTNNLLGAGPESWEYFRRAFQPLELSENSERNSTVIKIGKESFETEEIMAMLIQHARENSEKFGEGSIKDCAITVPSFWTTSQRQSMIDSAQAAGLNVLALMHENTGAAFYYGIDRMDNETDHLAIFYNLGASYLQVTLARYSAAKKTIKTTKQIENVEILAHASDSSLGGSLFDSLIASHLAAEFSKKHGHSVREIPKAMARLFQQANQVKKTLSANKSTLVQVNSLYKGIDFSYTFTREAFEALILPFSDRLARPIFEVLGLAGVEIGQVNTFEIIGGVSRIPRVQEIIKERTGLDTSTHLNGDESIAHGAAIYAANFSSVVQVRPMWLSDVNTRVISARFYSDSEEDWGKETVLFKYGAKLGSQKKITFGFNKDVKVVVTEEAGGKKSEISEYSVKGVEDIVKDEISLFFSFRMDFSGIVTLEAAEASYEVRRVKEAEGERGEEGEGKGDGETEKETESEKKEEEEEQDVASQEGGDEESGRTEGDGESGSNEERVETTEGTDSEANTDTPATANDTKGTDQSTPSDSESSEEAPTSKPVSKDKKLKEKRKVVSLKVGVKNLEQPQGLSRKDVQRITNRLESFKEAETQAKKLAEAKNDLESYIYFISDKIEDDKFTKVSSESSRESVSQLISALKSWMDSPEFDTTPRHEVKKKKRELESLVSDALQRESEAEVRAGIVENAYKELGRLEDALVKLNETKPWLPLEEMVLARVNLNETIFWLDAKVAEQNALQDWEALAFRTSEVESKVSSMKKQVEKLKKMQKPKDKPKGKKPGVPDFMNFGDDFDWSKVKMDNVKVDGKDFSWDGEKEANAEEKSQEQTIEEKSSEDTKSDL